MTNLVSFDFNGLNLRTMVDEKGNPWFVAVDVCKVLTIGNSRDAISRLDDDEKGVGNTDTRGGEQTVTIINESGLYSLIMTSRKPEAKAFKKWVTSEVLPSIRKTGSYSIPTSTETQLDKELKVLDACRRMLNLAPSATISMTKKLCLTNGINSSFLPDDGEGATKSATDLLAGRLTAANFNRRLHAIGYLEQHTRGNPKKFWSITGNGLKYGKNMIYPDNPQETKPQGFVSTFEELFDKIK